MTKHYFGFPPKLLMMRMRFMRTLASTLLIADEAGSVATVPAPYYDASHYLRDAKRFPGTTPRRFLALPTPYLRSVLRARSLVLGNERKPNFDLVDVDD